MGTDEIIAQLGARTWLDHFTAGRSYVAPRHAAELLESVRGQVRAMRGCDVVLYQAGADETVKRLDLAKRAGGPSLMGRHPLSILGSWIVA